MTPKGWFVIYGRGKLTPDGKDAIQVGQSDTASRWVALLSNPKSDALLRVAAAALGWLGKAHDSRAAAVSALVRATKDSSWDVRRNVAEAIGRIGDPTGAATLKALLGDKDSDGWVSAVAAQALTSLGGPNAPAGR